jgi:hypothetical protein
MTFTQARLARFQKPEMWPVVMADGAGDVRVALPDAAMAPDAVVHEEVPVVEP